MFHINAHVCSWKFEAFHNQHLLQADLLMSDFCTVALYNIKIVMTQRLLPKLHKNTKDSFETVCLGNTHPLLLCKKLQKHGVRFRSAIWI